MNRAEHWLIFDIWQVEIPDFGRYGNTVPVFLTDLVLRLCLSEQSVCQLLQFPCDPLRVQSQDVELMLHDAT